MNGMNKMFTSKGKLGIRKKYENASMSKYTYVHSKIAKETKEKKTCIA
jgi:hypothetical protein